MNTLSTLSRLVLTVGCLLILQINHVWWNNIGGSGVVGVSAVDDDDSRYVPNKVRYTKAPQHLLDSGIVILNDKNFEHETQASTGQTTGSWLIYFHSDNDKTQMAGTMPSSSVLQEEYHTTVAVMNVISNDKKLHSSKTFKRLQVKRLPSFIYIHKGRLYDLPKTVGHGYSWEHIIEFIKNPPFDKSRDVPIIPSIWSIVIEEIKKDTPEAIKVFCIIFISMTIVFAFLYWLSNKLIPLDDDNNNQSKKRR